MSTATITDTAARVVDLTKVYGRADTEVRALDGVTLDFRAGGFTAMMGPSGSGKSTLMHCMAALDRPTSGRVQIGDTDSGLSDKDLTLLRRDRIGFVFQAFNLLPRSRRGRTSSCRSAWPAVGRPGLAGHRDQHAGPGRPPEPPAGRAVRRPAAACRRCARPGGRPDIVFADEPTGNLDSAASDVLDFLRRSVDEFSQTVVMVTHDPTAAAYSDRALFLDDGRIVERLEQPTRERVLGALGHLQSEAVDHA